MEQQDKLDAIARVIAHLNEKAGAHFRPRAASAQRHMLARMAEGYTEQDMLDVVDGQCAAWLGNETMERYLRPETLFGPKMDGYLQAACRAQKKAVPTGGGFRLWRPERFDGGED